MGTFDDVPEEVLKQAVQTAREVMGVIMKLMIMVANDMFGRFGMVGDDMFGNKGGGSSAREWLEKELPDTDAELTRTLLLASIAINIEAMAHMPQDKREAMIEALFERGGFGNGNA